jgi:hypothetical protein
MAATIRASTAPTATLNPSSPASTAIGDLVLVFTWTVVAGNGVPTHTLQGGFTEIRSHAHDDSSTDGRLSVAYKVAAANGANGYQAYTSSAGTSISGIVVLTVGTWEQANVLLIGDQQNSITGTTNGAPDPAAITTAQAQSLVLQIGAWHYGSTSTTTTVTVPTNYAAVTEVAGAAVGELAIAQRTIANSGTAENAAAWGDNTTPNGTVAMTIAFRPRNVSITADAVSMALTVNDAGLTAQRKITAATDPVVVTGTSTELSRRVPMTAIVGALTLAVNDTGVMAQRLLIAAAAAFALSSNASGLTAQHRLSAATATFTLAGNDATLTYTPADAGYTMLAGTGSFSMAGSATALLRGYRLAAACGAFVEAGSAAGLTVARKLSVSVGAVVETGRAVTFARGQVMTVVSEQFSCVGGDVSFAIGKGMPAASYPIALTGPSVPLAAHRGIGATSAAFLVTGNDALRGVNVPIETEQTLVPLQRPTVFIAGRRRRRRLHP